MYYRGMDEFNADIDETPMRKNMPVRTLKIQVYDNTKKSNWNNKAVFVNIQARTSSTIKKSYVCYDASCGKMRYVSNNCRSPCCSQESRLNSERASYRRDVINPAIHDGRTGASCE
jgi:hypothetical protein